MADGSAFVKSVQDSVNLSVKRSNTGTMMFEAGTSQFYAKHSIIPIVDSATVEDDNRRSSVKLTKLTILQDGATRFPKLAECAHFHYEYVDFGNLELAVDEGIELDAQSEQWFLINVLCNERKWIIRRTYDSLYTMDKQLHRCIYDRKFSMLPELTKDLVEEEGSVRALGKISAYLTRLSVLANSMINCGPILCWMEMDNRGKHLIVPDNDAAVNIPAIGAAHAIKRYVAQSADEISLEVGDILSIIDKPSAQESSWWRGKKEFEVGYFPSDYVEMIGNSKLPAAVATKVQTSLAKPVLHRRGKVTSFLIGFFSSRPNRTALKRTGIMKERVFGCDLGEHLLNSGQDVPLVLKCCAEVLEKHGIVDGIYRLCGVASNLQKLRNEFDEDHIPDLTTEMYLQDVHCISSLVKMYFRELPNPLLTYQLYDKFTSAIDENSYDGKLNRLRKVVQQLPPPHYRTTEFLMRHLSYMASFHSETSMHCKNLAIVWAPNLLRSKELEQENCVAALKGAGLQAVVTEFLIANVDEIFEDSGPCSTGLQKSISHSSLIRPKSLCAPPSGAAKLLSLEEAQERALGTAMLQQKYLSVGGGPAALPPIYHTVIDLPKDGKKTTRRTTTSNLRALFARNHSVTLPSSGSESPISLQRKVSVVEEEKLKRNKIECRKQDKTDSSCDFLEGKRLSVSCDVFDSIFLDPRNTKCHSPSSSLISKPSSVNYCALSTDVTANKLLCHPVESAVAQDDLMSLNPVSLSGTSPSLRRSKPQPRSQISLAYSGNSIDSKFVSHSSVTDASPAVLVGNFLTPPSISVSSFDSEQLSCYKHESETTNLFESVKCYTDCTGSTNSFTNFLLSSAHNQDLEQQLEYTDCSAFPIFKESVTATGTGMLKNCYSGSEGEILSSNQAYKSFTDEQEFLSWKLSELSGSNDLLNELSPAINRVMPRSTVCASSVKDLALSINGLENPDMYDSCESLNIIIPASCDIGSIPENIGGSLNEDFLSYKRFSSRHCDFSTLNFNSKPSAGDQDVIREFPNEDLPSIKGSDSESYKIPLVPQLPGIVKEPVIQQASVQCLPCLNEVLSQALSSESDVMHSSESLSFQDVDPCSLMEKDGVQMTRKDRNCMSTEDRSSPNRGISINKRGDVDSVSCTSVCSERLTSSDQQSLPWMNAGIYRFVKSSGSTTACCDESGKAQGCPQTDSSQHPIQLLCNRATSADESGVRSEPPAVDSIHKQLNIGKVEQDNRSSAVELAIHSTAGIEALGRQFESMENTREGGGGGACRHWPSNMPVHHQSNRFKEMFNLPSTAAGEEDRKGSELLPVGPLMAKDGTSCKDYFKLDKSFSGKDRKPNKMQSTVTADEERIKSPSSSASSGSVSSLSLSSLKLPQLDSKWQTPSSSSCVESTSTGNSPVTPVFPVSYLSQVKEGPFQSDHRRRIAPSHSSASEFFSDFLVTPDASQKAYKESDSDPSYSSAMYAEVLRSRAARSEPPEVLRKPRAGTYVSRSSAQIFQSSVNTFSPTTTNSEMLPGTFGSLEERRKLFESAVVNSTSNV